MATIEAAEPIRDLVERRDQRHGTRYLRFYSPVPGTIVDVSRRGLCLETVAKLTPGAEYLFRIRQGSLLFNVTGLVKWSRYRGTLASSSELCLELFRSGVELRQPLPEETLDFLVDGISSTA